MEGNNKSIFKSTMESGVVFGIVLVILNIGQYFYNIKHFSVVGNVVLFFIDLIISFFFIYFYTKRYRDQELNGFMTFNQAFLYGILIMFFSAIILSFFFYVLYKFIDPDLAHKNIEQVKDWYITFMQNHGISEDQIDTFVKKLEAGGIPDAEHVAFSNVLQRLFLGIILSLISAAILKKIASPFDTEKHNNDI